MTKRRTIFSRSGTASVVIALALALLTPVNASSAPRNPSLRLVGSADHLEVMRYPGDPGVGLEMGTFLAAVGGPFELRVRRQGDGYAVSQVVPRSDGTVRKVRDLPDDVVRNISRGLRRFFTLTLTQDGETVVNEQVPLCIGGYEPSRLNDDGPQMPQYPTGCYSSDLTRATVWGIDNGWAVQVPEYFFVEVPDGSYRARLAINPRYVRLFDIPAAHSKTSLRLKVSTMEDEVPCEYPPEEPPKEPGPGEPEPGDSDPPQTKLGEEPCPEPPFEPVEYRSLDEIGTQTRPSALKRADVDPAADGLPDLAALPSTYIEAVVDERGHDVLMFGATVWNKGPGPLVVEGFRRRGDDLMDAYQYLYDDGEVVRKLDAGTLEYDNRDGHDHWHFTDFARYRLLDASRDVAVRSRKEAFCLAPTDAIDLTLRNANWSPGETGLQSACGGPSSIWIREILDVGWGDTYQQSVPGQSFNISDLPNGVYYVEVQTNPQNNLREVTRANNTAYTKIRLRGAAGNRRVICDTCTNGIIFGN